MFNFSRCSNDSLYDLAHTRYSVLPSRAVVQCGSRRSVSCTCRTTESVLIITHCISLWLGLNYDIFARGKLWHFWSYKPQYRNVFGTFTIRTVIIELTVHFKPWPFSSARKHVRCRPRSPLRVKSPFAFVKIVQFWTERSLWTRENKFKIFEVQRNTISRVSSWQ